MRLARLTATATVLVAACIAPAAASAQAPAGDWTFVRKDAFRHYACKDKAEKGRWNVKTATYFNGKDDAVEMGIGAYAAIARGSNKNLVASRDSSAWKGGYIRFTLRGVAESDRLWMQGSYYGPSEPWSDGFTVRRLDRCD